MNRFLNLIVNKKQRNSTSGELLFHFRSKWLPIKVARYSFSESIPPKFERKLPRHKQSFGKIATIVVLDEDENLLLSGLTENPEGTAQVDFVTFVVQSYFDALLRYAVTFCGAVFF